MCSVWACCCAPLFGIPGELLEKPDAWFRSEAGQEKIANVLSWQAEAGGWPKNKDTSAKRYVGERKKLSGTFDNSATTDELRFLAHAYNATKDENCKAAFDKGLDHILEAQFANGGWPQYFPLSKQYHRHITFNDGAMVRVMIFLQEVERGDGYEFVPLAKRKAAGKAVEKGVECILKCQIVIDGKPTVWCAQHDEVTLAPADARSFELASLSGSESAGVLRFLMALEKPSAGVKRAVEGGVEWFRNNEIRGFRYERKGGKRLLIPDENAAPLWARFYDIETGKPFFCDRDGVKKWNYGEISPERTHGYSWYGNWGKTVLNDYRKWKAK